MRHFALLILFVSLSINSQETIDAKTILQDIKDGKSISITNKTITGDLDLTYMQEALTKLPKKSSWWNKGDSNTVEKDITSKLSFINCIFKNDVLAYIHDEDNNYTFVANFEDEVTFKDCTFKGKAMFKYSDFNKNTDFRGTKFLDYSTFKYASFEKEISFYNSLFKEASTFKYANFKTFVSFSNTVFNNEAIFKYTEFENGVSFKNVKFENHLNIKYMEVSGNFETENMVVSGSVDSKYTDINGKDLSHYYNQ